MSLNLTAFKSPSAVLSLRPRILHTNRYAKVRVLALASGAFYFAAWSTLRHWNLYSSADFLEVLLKDSILNGVIAGLIAGIILGILTLTVITPPYPEGRGL